MYRDIYSFLQISFFAEKILLSNMGRKSNNDFVPRGYFYRINCPVYQKSKIRKKE